MIEHVAVVVPAHNEQDRLPACLDALRLAREHLRRSLLRPPTVSILVVLDDCTDDSALIVTGSRGVESVAVGVRSVGAARAAGARRVLSMMRPALSELSGVWLANTDADSTVPVDWLTRMVTFAESGIEIVLGTVEPDRSESSAQLSAEWYHRHVRHDHHPHVHGANLGIRADTYLRLGEWDTVRSGEDVRLALRAGLAGTPVARTAAIPVRTSDRLVGRAPYGFADYLRVLQASLTDAMRLGGPAQLAERSS